MVIARYPPLLGGTENACHRLSHWLVAHGWNVKVVTGRWSGLSSHEVLEEVPVRRLSQMDAGIFRMATFGFSLSRYLSSHRNEYDLVHAHLASSPAVIAARYCRKYGKPFILKAGGSRATGDVGTSRGFLGHRKLKFLASRLDALVCTNSEIAEEWKEWGVPPAKQVSLPNAVDTSVFRPCSEDEKKSLRQNLGIPDGPVAIFSGRLDPARDFPTVIKSWVFVARKYPRACLLVAGSGSQEAQWEKLSRALGLSQNIRFLGLLSGTSILHYLQASDVFVLPSLGEGMSNALLEAMACGLACVANDVDGNRQLLEDAGMLVPVGDEKVLSENINWLFGFDAHRKRLGSAARDRVAHEYSFEKIAPRYEHLYQNMGSGVE